MKVKHLVIAAHDGVFSYYTGVGTIVQNTIKTLCETEKIPDLKISVAGISLNPQGEAFDLKTFESCMSLVKKYEGELIFLANDTEGYKENDTWKNPVNWKFACNSLVSTLNTLLREDEDNVIMLHDTVFLYFEIAQRQLKPELRKSIRSFYLPHSSGKCHSYTDKSWNSIRLEYENQCFNSIMNNPTSRLIATGHNFAQHLIDNYGVSFSNQDFLTNGLMFDNYCDSVNRFSTYNDIKKIVPALSSESKIIFSWGRLSQAKGFYELLQAWEVISNDYPGYSLVLQAPTSCIEESEYFKKFSMKVKSVPRVYHIDDFSPHIWQTFLRYDKTDVVCLASTMDPNPHTPIEAKLFCRDMNYVILASFKDGIKDSFSQGECVPLNDPYDIEDFSDKLITAFSVPKEKRRQMSLMNLHSVFSFNYKNNVLRFLKNEGVIV